MNLLDDLFTVQSNPAFPAAAPLLNTFAHQIQAQLFSHKNKEQVLEQSYLTLAFDTLGKISSSYAQSIQTVRSDPIRLPLDQSSDDMVCEDANPSNSSEDTRCICNRPHVTNTFMLDCDRCHRWYHGSCVGIRRDAVPDAWFCDECKIVGEAKKQAKVWAPERASEAANQEGSMMTYKTG